MTRRPYLAAMAATLIAATMAAAILIAAALVAAPPAHAEASLGVSGVRQEPGLVEFNLTARDLPTGQQVDPESVTIEADGVPLPVLDVVEVATTGSEDLGHRLAVLVIDISDSMFGQPIADAVAAASEYATDLPTDVELAIVTVGTTARTALPPTADRDQAHEVLDALVTEGSTALYDGLAIAADLAGDPRSYTERRVLVLSDGADSSSATTLPVAQEQLAEAGTPVDTVAYRTEETVADLLAGVSAATGGQAYLAADAADLAGAFRSAADAFTVRLLVTAEVPAELSGADTRLAVSVRAGRQTLSASVPLVVASQTDAAGLIRVPGGLSPLAEVGLLALVFSALLTLGLVAVAPLLERKQRRRRLAQVEQFSRPRPAPSPSPQAQPGSPVTRAALALSERVVQSQGGLEGRIALTLDRAGMRMRPHEWLLLRGLVCVIAMLLLGLFIGPLLALPVGLLVGWAGTELYQRNRIERRTVAFAGLLPDALQLIIGSLRSGFSLPQAIDAMVSELPDPITSEFGRALGEVRLGVSLEDALERVARRMKNNDLAWAVVAIRVQQDVGGNLAEVLTTTVKTIREREALHRHVRALSADGRLSAWILIALPLLAGVFMFTFRGEYARSLYTEPVGIVMLLVGIVLLVIGTFWMSRVVKVEV
jgi:tight adherence protein B